MFLKGNPTAGQDAGEITEYAGITIDWIRGKKAVLTIFDEDGKSVEDIKLYEMQTREEMHKLMVEKGFQKKTRSQKITEMQEERREKQLSQIEAPSSFYSTLTGLYIVVFVLLAGVGAFFLNGRKIKRKGTIISSIVSRV